MMITIRACRTGYHKGRNTWNQKLHGVFQLHFESVDELVSYMIKSVGIVCFPYIDQDLTESQRRIMRRKYRAHFMK